VPGGTGVDSYRVEMSNGTEKFQKKDNLKRLTEIFEMSFRKFSVPFDFELDFSEFFGQMIMPINTKHLFFVYAWHKK